MEAPVAGGAGEDEAPLSGLLVLVAGPIASGKSTLARAVARRLREQGTPAAAVDVDLVYELLEERGSSAGEPEAWRRAHRLGGRIVAALFAEGVEVAVAEGDFLDEDTERDFLAAARPAHVRKIVLRASLETALGRVLVDDDRGISRDRAFLARHYEEIGAALTRRPAAELLLDTDEMSLEEAVAATVAACGSSLPRGSRWPPTRRRSSCSRSSACSRTTAR